MYVQCRLCKYPICEFDSIEFGGACMTAVNGTEIMQRAQNMKQT